MSDVKLIVLTGGPGGGKTSALAVLAQKLPELGIHPIFVPEVATTFLSSGVSAKDVFRTNNTSLTFQETVFEHQAANESTFRVLSSLSPKSVLILDRGLMDGGAYVPYSQFIKMAEKFGYSLADIFGRYTGVIHLVTAADGAEKFYNLDNPARYESKEEAIAVDRRLQDVWSGHPSFRIVGNIDSEGNSIDFGKKMDLVLQEVCSLIGAPVPVETERKFLLEDVDITALPVHLTGVLIRQYYLNQKSPEVERRIRKWRLMDNNNTSLYFYTEKWRANESSVSRFVSEKQISADAFIELLDEKDMDSLPVAKRRYCFTWNGMYFELDQMTSPVEISLLEVQVTESERNIQLPSFLNIKKEVTDDERYKMVNISRGSLR